MLAGLKEYFMLLACLACPERIRMYCVRIMYACVGLWLRAQANRVLALLLPAVRRVPQGSKRKSSFFTHGFSRVLSGYVIFLLLQVIHHRLEEISIDIQKYSSVPKI